MLPRFVAMIATACAVAISFAAGASVSPPPNVPKKLGVYTPRPAYPLYARLHGIAGNGVFLLRVHIKSGRVTQVIVGLSTGSTVLDRTAQETLLTWRFKPGAMPYYKITSVHMSPPQTEEETFVKVAVTFTLTNA